MATNTLEYRDMCVPVVTEGNENGSLSADGRVRSTVQGTPLDAETLRKTDSYWRACNYLSLGMIYLQDNPLLREPLRDPSTSRTGSLDTGERAQA
jgi:hypothetical protein